MGRKAFKPISTCSAVLGLLCLVSVLYGCSSEQDARHVPLQSPEIGASEVFVEEGLKDGEPETISLVDCDGEVAGCREIFDCTVRASQRMRNCERRKLAFDSAACVQDEDPDLCRNFEQRFDQVNLIADRSNFVSAPLGNQPLSVELVTQDLRVPWDLEFLPDGSMLVTQLSGELVRIDTSGEVGVVHKLEMLRVGEAGLMGLAVDPDFVRNRHIYLSYVYKLDDSDPEFASPVMATARRLVGKISRWTYENGQLSDETVLIDNIPGSIVHAGSRLEFGPDGNLYATTGDADVAMRTQEPGFLGGKVLRLNKDGSIPEDNPFPDSYVYSLGHRNPQGLAWDPETKDLYTSEHGPTRYDEINRVRPGQNNGWGIFKCRDRISEATPVGEVVFPVVCFDKWTLAPSGMQFVSDTDSVWYGSLFVAGLRGHHLHRFTFEDGKVADNEIFYIPNSNDYKLAVKKTRVSPQTRDVEYHNGALYILGNHLTLLRVSPGLEK